MILYASLSLLIISHSHSELYLYFVRLVILLGDGAKIGAKHERSFHQAPESEHAPVLCVCHTTFANKKSIRVVPSKFWSLDSSLSVTHLIVDVDVPEQTLPGVRDVLTGPPQVPHLAAERLNVAETPGAELEGDVPLVSNPH